MADVIGAVAVEITGDQTKLNAAMNSAVQEAKGTGEKIGNALSAAAIKSATLQLSVDTLKQKLQSLAEVGVRTAAQQQQMEVTAARVAIAEDRLALSLEHVAAAGGHAVSQVQATSGAIRTLEGAGALRAVENFIAKTLGLGGAMQAIFPIVGAVAMTEIIVHMGEKLVEAFNKGRDAMQKMQGESRALLLSQQASNDALQVTNDKLDIEIAKLTGKKPNTLKLMLDEAKESADKLAEALAKDGKALFDFLKQNAPGLMSQAFGTAGIKDIVEKQGGRTGAGGTNKEMAETLSSSRQALDSAKTLEEKNRIITENNKKIAAIADREIADSQAKLKDAQAELGRRNDPRRALAGINLTGAGVTRETPGTRDTEIRIEALSTRIASLQNQKTTSQLTTLEGPKKDTLAGLQEAKAAAEQWMHQQEEMLTKLRTEEGEFFTPKRERAFWEQRLSTAVAGGKIYESARLKIESDIARLSTEIQTKNREAEKAAVAEQKRDFEDQLKEVINKAEASGSATPKTTGLQFAMTTLAKPQLNEGQYKGALEKIPELTREAAAESEAILKKMLKDSDDAFQEQGEHSAAQMADYYGKILTFLESIGGAEDEILAARAKKRSADKAKKEENVHVASIDAAASEQQNNADVIATKTILQARFEAEVGATVQKQIENKRQLLALDTLLLEDKRETALAEFQVAVASGSRVKIEEASIKWLQADNDIRNKRIQNETELAKIARESTPQYQIQSGLMKDFETSVDGVGGKLARAVVQGSGVGKALKESLSDLETSALTTVTKSITTQLLNAAKPVLTSITGAIGGTIGGMLGKIGLSGVDPKLAAETANTTSVNMLTASNYQLLAAIQANSGVTIGNTASTGTNTGATIANTVAVGANTIAHAVKSLVSGVAGIFGAAKSVSGAVGLGKEAVTSSISFGGQAAQAAATTAETTATVAETGAVVADTATTAALVAANTAIATENAALVVEMTANTVALAALTAAVIDLATVDAISAFLPFADGGRPPLHKPSLVGERGRELFIPDEAGTIIPADETEKLLRGVYNFSQPIGVPPAPDVPAGASGIAASVASSGAGDQINHVTNQNTGSIGQMHFNIYGNGNPKELARQIANEIKRATPKFSPVSG